MRRALFAIILGLAACSSQGPCTNATHDGCDLDGGTSCDVHQTCIDAETAIDPCPSGSKACCFQVCSPDSGCPDEMFCADGYCAEGRCVADAGP